MLVRLMDRAAIPLGWFLQRKDMETLGISNSMRIGKAYSRLKYARYQKYRVAQYRNHFAELLEENGTPQTSEQRGSVQRGSVNRLKDGWALDTSGTLPHLKQHVEDMSEVIAERGGVKRESFGKPFILEVPTADLVHKYPSVLDFVTSSEVLKPICDYFGFIPLLSSAKPPGVRLMESSAEFDDSRDGPLRESQLFHLDYHDCPMLYVIVTLNDIAMEHGPWCFLPRSTSDRAVQALRYRSRGTVYRVPDEMMYSVVDESELQRLCHPAGAVHFIDSGNCFHYGSRNAVKRRYHMMYSFTSACKTDFGDLLRKQRTLECRTSDSRLRKMILNRTYMD